MTIDAHQGGLYYLIPAEIFDDSQLEWTEVAFYALLAGLSDKYGYCFASNKNLSMRMRKGEEQIERYLKKLETLGYITRISKKNGTLWDRKIYINVTFKKSLRTRVDEASNPHTRGIEPSPIPPIVSKEIVSKDKPPIPSLKKIQEKQPKERKEVAKFVCVNPAQEEKLLEMANGNQELVKKWYEHLSVWKISKNIEYRPNDFAAIARWVIAAVEEAGNKPPAQTREKEDMILAKAIESKYPKHPHINYGYNYIEFVFGTMNCVRLQYGDNGFKEQLTNNLRKMGLTL